MLRKLQIVGLLAVLFLALGLPLGFCLRGPDNRGGPLAPERLPAYLKSSEAAEAWARARYLELAGRRRTPVAARPAASPESAAGAIPRYEARRGPARPAGGKP